MPGPGAQRGQAATPVKDGVGPAAGFVSSPILKARLNHQAQNQLPHLCVRRRQPQVDQEPVHQRLGPPPAHSFRPSAAPLPYSPHCGHHPTNIGYRQPRAKRHEQDTSGWGIQVSEPIYLDHEGTPVGLSTGSCFPHPPHLTAEFPGGRDHHSCRADPIHWCYFPFRYFFFPLWG